MAFKGSIGNEIGKSRDGLPVHLNVSESRLALEVIHVQVDRWIDAAPLQPKAARSQGFLERD